MHFKQEKNNPTQVIIYAVKQISLKGGISRFKSLKKITKQTLLIGVCYFHKICSNRDIMKNDDRIRNRICQFGFLIVLILF